MQHLSRLLLASGVTIEQMNAVRSALSTVKAGGLARAFAPAAVVVLVLSDVYGDDLATIGSGPFYQGALRDPIGIVRQTGIASQVDFPLFELLRRATSTNKKTAAVPHRVIGNHELAVQQAYREAKALGVVAEDPDLTFVMGEARHVAMELLQQFTELELDFDARGGETTVTVTGTGLGGRCQEMATSVAPSLAGQSGLAFLAAGTDGSDGPSEYAGAVVDSESDGLARTAGHSAESALANNDSQSYLAACGGLITTGPTGTNLNDLMMLLRLR